MSARGPRLLLALSVVVALAAAALRFGPRFVAGSSRARAQGAEARAVFAREADDAHALPRPPAFAARCVLRGVAAQLHAQALDQRARLHWQRAPFEDTEAVRATQLSAEAEVCYRAAGDRGGAQRAASRHRRYAAEAARRERVAQLHVRGPSARELEGGVP